jgi:hypothetical protein
MNPFLIGTVNLNLKANYKLFIESIIFLFVVKYARLVCIEWTVFKACWNIYQFVNISHNFLVGLLKFVARRI